MKNIHLPAFAGWQVLTCPLVELLLSSCCNFLQKTAEKCLPVLVMLFCTAGDLSSQVTVTWNGATNTDWGTGSNWSGGTVPDAVSKVIIPNTAKDPVISGNATNLSVTVQNGAVLTITPAAHLLIVSNTPDVSLLNHGTVTNNGIIQINASFIINSFYDTGIKNYGTFNNNAGGNINMMNTTVGLWNAAGTFVNQGFISIVGKVATTEKCMYNEASFNNTGSIDVRTSTLYLIENFSGTFTNSGSLSMGFNQYPAPHGVVNRAVFNNNGSLSIDGTTDSGITNAAGTFNNAASIIIGNATGRQYGIQNDATFNNNAGGNIYIERSISVGFWNNAGTFTNAATLTIGPVPVFSSYTATKGIYNESTFNNNTGGVINVDNSSTYGIEHYTGTFTNRGTINIGSTGTVGTIGLISRADFNNIMGGMINANNTSQYGMEHVSGTFTNAATINIGSLSAVGSYGLRNSADFNNNTGGVIKIDRSSSFGLRNNAGTFTNAATLTIGSLAAVGTTGISNAATINNNAGGTISIDRVTIRGIINVTGTVANAGTLTIGNNAATSAMDYGIDNSATFNNNSGGQINIDRSTTSGVIASAGTFTNQGGLTIGALAPLTNLITANTGTFSNGIGGTLKGTGNIAAANFSNAGGTLSPGYSPGKMTFTAGENFSSNILFVEVNGTGTAGVHFDQVVVTGTATLGGTLAVSVGYTPVNGHQVTILSATAISGTFGTVTGLPANWYVNYTSNAVVLTFGAALPVELVDFTARLVVDAAQLDWRTASERNNQGFYIERRTETDGQWTEIGFLPGHGHTTETNDYSFLDEKPLPGLNYYRLRQVDTDGHFKYSNMVSLEVVGKGSQPVLFPNPASTTVHVRFSQEFSAGKLAVFDVAGRLVLLQDLEAGSQAVQLSTAELASGTYFCRFELDSVVFLEKLHIR